MKLSIILLIPILILSFHPSLSYNPADSADHRETVDIICQKKVPIVQLTLNDRPAYFLLDSGSELTMLHREDAAIYTFHAGKEANIEIAGYSGKRQTLYSTQQVKLAMGNQQLKTPIYALNLTHIIEVIEHTTGIRIHGIIGLDLMRAYGFRIDYVGKKLRLNN